MKALKLSTLVVALMLLMNNNSFAQFPWNNPAPATKKATTTAPAKAVQKAATTAVKKEATKAATPAVKKATAAPKVSTQSPAKQAAAIKNIKKSNSEKLANNATKAKAQLATGKGQQVSPKESSVTWTGYKVGGKHTGTVMLSGGELFLDEGKLTGGKFEIDMTTIACTDLQGDQAKKLEGHLKNNDFFGTETYPKATFEITKVISRGAEGDYKVIGDLTIKKTKKSIKFNVRTSGSADGTTASTRISVDRSDFDVRYGSGSFFDKLGDKTIYDEFDIDLILVTRPAPAATPAAPATEAPEGK